MDLTELINRTSPPIPWQEGDNIPWNEPGFSRRMLREHLSQEHDAASRRFSIIDRHVDWIHTNLLAYQPTRILDLCCGPGFYTQRLARMGHTCYGIDYSPASIEYAILNISTEKLAINYTCQDIRQAQFPAGVGLVMLIYGEFNVFKPTDAILILDKAWQALNPGGIILLEPHPYPIIQRLGDAPAKWYSSPGGLFSEHPHLVLKENFWDTSSNTCTNRYFVLEAKTGQVTRFAQSMQAYEDAQYRALLSSHGFTDIQLLPGLSGNDSPAELIAITARKQS
jgi:SAM-dependent methyltransferase